MGGETEVSRRGGEGIDAKQARRRQKLEPSAKYTWVMMMGSTTVAQLLLRHGANPNLQDSSTGSTPLHDAARQGFLDTVEILIESRADPNIMDYNNRRPIDLARENGHLQVVAFLESL
ncbi:hypothetical protein JZ751_012624 [Albula glossodonta]|uniref:Uncharacterized protein n=1 Tax=Albula glossodonta TaxID=121402 RepID=A0A8T2P3E6_9TELE|nr:hypothetical protein JZ751_012624 [Albula glossodonta]